MLATAAFANHSSNNNSMSHIFISYSSKDRPKTRALATVFEKKGWKVWWDKNLMPGKAFDRAIGKALDEASCIVVLWSPNSVDSDWVLEEAYEVAEAIAEGGSFEDGIEMALSSVLVNPEFLFRAFRWRADR